jgi:hypothetical protein
LGHNTTSTESQPADTINKMEFYDTDHGEKGRFGRAQARKQCKKRPYHHTNLTAFYSIRTEERQTRPHESLWGRNMTGNNVMYERIAQSAEETEDVRRGAIHSGRIFVTERIPSFIMTSVYGFSTTSLKPASNTLRTQQTARETSE